MNSNLAGDEIGKLFVGGLDWSTTQETLRNYFSQYGEVVDCVIMKDKTTNQSRGFGFVKFKDPNCVRTVLETKPHNLDGRNIDPKPCTPRGMQPEKTRSKDGWKGSKSDSNKSKKIFVGGIPHNCGEPELRDYFSRFGVVEVKKAEPRDSKAPGPGQPGASQWGHRGILSTANGWSAPPAPAWQQSYGPQGVWVSTGQPIGGYGPPACQPRSPRPAPSPFNAFLVTATPTAGFGPPQGYPQQGYATPPNLGTVLVPLKVSSSPRQECLPLPPRLARGPWGSLRPPPDSGLEQGPAGQPDFPYSQYGLGSYPQDPSAYGPTRPSHSYGQDEQGYSAGYGQDLSGFGQTFADPSQQTPSYGAPTAQAPAGPQPTASTFGRGQNHNVQGFHPYRR